mgnify:CR=1 FL=1
MCSPSGSWSRCRLAATRRLVLTRDTSPLEPTVAEYKLYAPGVGLVLTLDVSGGTGRETLVKIDKAGPKDGTGPIRQAKSVICGGFRAYGSSTMIVKSLIPSPHRRGRAQARKPAAERVLPHSDSR